jgi:ubiquinone/menaquinone biosynthesis C-methylase UbiE
MSDSSHPHSHFVPAAGHAWLLPLYDPLNRLLGEERIKGPLVDQAAIAAGHRVLDIGCGTGSLTLIAKRRHPDADVVGLDPDPKALARARRKAQKAGLSIRFDEAFANELPYQDASFDRALSSLMFHHLDRDVKTATLGELYRVLVPGGSLHLLDFGPPRSGLARVLTGLIHHGDHMRDNLDGAIPGLMEAAGFDQAAEVGHRSTLFGSLSCYRAVKCSEQPPGS